jgi:CRP-like cAMP-binding protein
MATIQAIPFFRNLKRVKLKSIMQTVKVAQPKTIGSYLFQQGDPVTCFYVTLKGEFRITKKISYDKPANQGLIKEIALNPLQHKKKYIFAK